MSDRVGSNGSALERWCRLTNETHVEAGDFIRCEVCALSGEPLHHEVEFLEHLAELMMQRYEGRKGTVPVELPDPDTPNRRRTKHHYRRLFNELNGVVAHTQEFITVASETLALWLEQTRIETLYSEGSPPHNSDPAYDVLSIIRDNTNTPHLQVVQVKATKKSLQSQAGQALAKFQKLENGEYDAELSSRLELISYNRECPPGVDVAELLFDSSRRYRVTLVHGQTENTFQILTTYNEKIIGPTERRSAYLIHADFDEFWQALSRIVHDQLD